MVAGKRNPEEGERTKRKSEGEGRATSGETRRAKRRKLVI